MARPWFAFYFSDYVSKTDHLSLAEHGAYLLLMGSYYKTGCKLPANAMQLQRICRAFGDEEVAAMHSVLDQFFEKREDGYYHKRIEEELQKSNEISEKRSKAAQKRYKKDAKEGANESANDVQLQVQKHTQSQSQSQPHTQSQLQPPEKPLAQSENIFITLTLNTGEEHPILENKITEWRDLYPAVDVEQALRNMRGWLDSNPTKRKTKKGINRFINSWLTKEQDKGGKKSSNDGRGTDAFTRGTQGAFD